MTSSSASRSTTASGSEGAGVAIAFRHAAGGEEHVYEVSRPGPCRRKVREELQVSLDGLPDRWHSEHWGQLVEDFFPLEVSQLFFFDAEKIRSLAEDETSSQVLGTAVKSLLGLDIAERLIADAAVLETRLSRGIEADRPREDRAGLEREVERLTAEIDGHEDRPAANYENVLLRTRSESRAAGRGVQGGRRPALGGSRRAASAGIEELKKEIDECESRLVALSATELPLCLVGRSAGMRRTAGRAGANGGRGWDRPPDAGGAG